MQMHIHGSAEISPMWLLSHGPGLREQMRECMDWINVVQSDKANFQVWLVKTFMVMLCSDLT